MVEETAEAATAEVVEETAEAATAEVVKEEVVLVEMEKEAEMVEVSLEEVVLVVAMMGEVAMEGVMVVVVIGEVAMEGMMVVAVIVGKGRDNYTCRLRSTCNQTGTCLRLYSKLLVRHWMYKAMYLICNCTSANVCIL